MMIPPPKTVYIVAPFPKPPPAFGSSPGPVFPESESAFSSRRSSSVLWSNYDDVSNLGGSSTSSSSSLRHSVTDISECRLQRLARNFVYPEDTFQLALSLKKVPPATYAICNKHTEPVPRPCSALAVALPTRPSYLNANLDRRTQTPRSDPRSLFRRRSSNWTSTPSDSHSRPSSRRPPTSDLHVPTLEEEAELRDYAPDVTSRTEGPCPSYGEDLHRDFITLPRVTLEEQEDVDDSTTFMDLVKGLAIPYITVSRSSTPSNILDVRTMSEVVGRVRSAKKHLPPAGGATGLGTRTKTRVNQPYLTPGSGSRLVSNSLGGSK